MRRIVSVFTLAGFLAASLVPPAAQADIVTTQDYLEQSQADAQRERVIEMLQREEVRERLLAMGADPAAIEARVNALSGAEVEQLANRIDDMPAGAGVIEVLLFVVLVFVILDIAGVTDVFPFINSAE